MKVNGSPVFAAFATSAAAGPMFVTFTALAYLYLQIPHTVAFGAEDLGTFVLMMVPAAIVGFILAFVPNLLGSAVMATIGESAEWGRSPLAWSLAGGLAGTGLVLLFAPRDGLFADVGQEGGAAAFALIATSAICARICRGQFDWEPQA